MFFKARAQSTVEYIMLFMIVVAAIALSHKYVYRAMNARLKQIQEELSHKNQYAGGPPPVGPPPVGPPPVPKPWIIKTTGIYQTSQWGLDNEARCNDGYVAIGYLDSGNDEVHCAKLEITSPTDPNEKLCVKTTDIYQTSQWGGNDEARCYDNDIAIGYLDSGNDEVHCAKLALTKCTPGSPEPPPGLCVKTAGIYQTSQWGGDNEARCNDGDVAIGYLDSGNDEVHCAKLVVTPCG